MPGTFERAALRRPKRTVKAAARAASKGLAVLAGLGLAMTATAPVSTAQVASSVGSTSTAPVQVSIGRAVYQRIDGFGFSDAFGQAANLAAMPSDVRSEVYALLFDPTKGAGLDIVRFGIGGAGTVSDQLSLGQAALSFGVRTFYADAWSAPGLMKSNGSQDNGGYLCGSPGANCINGDYRQAYADYLAATAKAFAEQGLPLQAVDFVNEPEIGPGYPSMLMTPAQAADFVPYLGRALQQEGLRTTVACCDAEGWANSGGFEGAQAYTQAVLSDPQSARYVGLITSHGYTSAPTFPLTNERPVWETEWSTFQSWDPAWDDGTDASGLAWADNIYTALVDANVNAFLYWWGTTTYKENGDNEGLIMLGSPGSPTAGAYQASGRLWAFAAFSRFVRPGAFRLATTSSDPELDAVGFRSGSHLVLVVINNASEPEQVNYQLGAPIAGTAQPYLTDSTDTGTVQAAVPVTDGSFSASVPAGAVVSYVITANSQGFPGTGGFGRPVR
ncbi:MAG: glycoside hydrolase family 30 protein [Acidimicrobiales bacterium]